MQSKNWITEVFLI
nr:unnamed protein product [Callosobruchus analis]CAI5827311.1 unnamed protein product [Callosobruchus analis]CAI5837696.1 unnamed protein product [Callosobruchus analis]CAI5870498.1 unnamed protein product [Callosobruchus analis]